MYTTPTETRPGWTEQHLAPADAVKAIHRLGRKRTVHLLVEQRAQVTEDTYFPAMANVQVSRPVAEKYVDDAYAPFGAKGGKVHLVWCDTCLFIG